MNEEERYLADLKANGVDIPEVAETPKVEKPDEVEKPEETPSKEEALSEPEEPKKRSIYEEYKEKKQELRSEREAREALEKEVNDLKQKLNESSTPEERQAAKDEIDEFAKTIDADPETIRKMRELFLKDLKPNLDESLKKDLEEFKNWKQQNSQVLEQQLFEKEFSNSLKTIKELFPTASESELNDIKKELDVLSHTKEMHDKELDYVVFKNKDSLQNLVSPKKRGMESKDRKDVPESNSEFDINADYSKMTPTERDAWEKAYKSLGKNEGLVEDAEGRKMFM